MATPLTPAQRRHLYETWEGRCFYCDMPLSPHWEADHFPWPSAGGGTDLVPCCANCHDLKDRVLLADWPARDFVEAFKDLTPRGRILLAKLLRVMFAASRVTKIPLGQLELTGRDLMQLEVSAGK